MAEFALFYLDSPLRRKVKIGRTTPDGVMKRDGILCYLELDNKGKQNKKQWLAKIKAYGVFEGFILVVAWTEARMKRLKEWSHLVKEQILFTTFDRLEKPDEPWEDYDGNTLEI